MVPIVPVKRSSIAAAIRAGLRAGRAGFVAWIIFLGVVMQGATMAQAAAQSAKGETVTWTASVPSPDALKPGSRVALTIQGRVQDGWHAYSLKQAPDGPTPLLVKVEGTSVATASGVVTESRPTKLRDPAFGLDTQFHSGAFTLTVPVRLNANLKPGPQEIPLSIRFQTCNGSVCEPPKTVHLSAAVTLQAARQ